MRALAADADLRRHDGAVLVTAVLVVSACSLVYELLISALSSYFLGATVLHFSLTIGLFLFFMGAGSFLSRYVHTELLDRFVAIEIGIALAGGIAGAVLYAAYSLTEHYYAWALAMISVIGTLAGLEIPLLTRLLATSDGLKRSLANVLSFDYLGALVASIAFPVLLLPYLGLQRTALAVGLVNLGVAIVLLAHFRSRLAAPRRLAAAAGVTGAILLAALLGSFRLSSFLEQQLYTDPVVHAQRTPWQRIVMTQAGNDLRLYLDGALQFSSIDEYRYHEALVHVPMAYASRRQRVLVLGGGDGLAVRELLRYPEVEHITLVDIDPAMTTLAQAHAMLRQLNGASLVDPRVQVRNADGWKFLETTKARFDVVIIDLPDPSNLSLGRLYTVEFYRLARARMNAEGVLVTQSSSPFFAPRVYWSIHATLAEAFTRVAAYQAYVPSFGGWGFNLASNGPLSAPRQRLPDGLRYLDRAGLEGAFALPRDYARVDVEVNRLENQALVRYFDASWESL